MQAVQVNLSNHDVTQKGYTGANIDAVTKSGTNAWKGSVYYVFRLVGQRYNRGTDSCAAAPKFKEDTQGFTLGGPIIPDTLCFIASNESLKSSRNAPDFGPVGDSKTNVLIRTAEIAAAAHADSLYRIKTGIYDQAGSQLEVKDSLLKLDWTISDKHRANLRYTRTDRSEPNYPSVSANQLSLDSNGFKQGESIETLVGQCFADWTPALSNEAKLPYRDYKCSPVNNADLRQIGFNYTGLSPTGAGTRTASLLFGTERSRHFNNLATQASDAYLAGPWERWSVGAWARMRSRAGSTEAATTGEGGGATRSFVACKGLDSAGKYVYSTLATTEDLSTRQAKGESQWAVQRALR